MQWKYLTSIYELVVDLASLGEFCVLVYDTRSGGDGASWLIMHSRTREVPHLLTHGDAATVKLAMSSGIVALIQHLERIGGASEAVVDELVSLASAGPALLGG